MKGHFEVYHGQFYWITNEEIRESTTSDSTTLNN